MVFNIHSGSYHPPCCFMKSICSPWCLVSYRESFWSEVANPSTRSGKRNMSRCAIMASLLTTPVYMWVSTHPPNPSSLPSLPISFSNRLYVFVTLLFVLEGAAGGFLMSDFFSWCDYIYHHCCGELDCGHRGSWFLRRLNTVYNSYISQPCDLRRGIKRQGCPSGHLCLPPLWCPSPLPANGDMAVPAAPRLHADLYL